MKSGELLGWSYTGSWGTASLRRSGQSVRIGDVIELGHGRTLTVESLSCRRAEYGDTRRINRAGYFLAAPGFRYDVEGPFAEAGE